MYLVHDKLKIDEEVFVWNEAEIKRVKVSDHTPQQTQKWRHRQFPNKTLRLINVNSRSVVNKTDKVEIMLLKEESHIAIFTETWIRREIKDEDVFPLRIHRVPKGQVI